TCERMKPPRHGTLARQHSGGPSPALDRCSNSNVDLQSGGMGGGDGQIAELAQRAADGLRLSWRQLHRVEPPQGLSRDLLIRALAHQLQERAAGGASRALRRRLQILSGERETRGASFDPAVVLKTGTTLVRQWRGHTHAVLVRDG